MGLTFKENCPDLRNSRVIDVIRELKSFNAVVEVWDPWANPAEAHEEFGLALERGEPAAGRYDAVTVAVGHREFGEMGPATSRPRSAGARAWPARGGTVVKSIFAKTQSDGRL
jgi:UDP-N-acetyl-D-galactosamine dehydrogenase